MWKEGPGRMNSKCMEGGKLISAGGDSPLESTPTHRIMIFLKSCWRRAKKRRFNHQNLPVKSQVPSVPGTFPDQAFSAGEIE